jgi:NRPS condensation-like uncharacterized protein
MKNISEYSWYSLDNAAKIFPAVSEKDSSSVFRMSVRLDQDVDEKILEEAVNAALFSFPAFRVQMRRGLFWYYLEHNFERALVSKENSYPCEYIEADKNNGFLFKCSYYKNKISLDVFHVLADGISVTNFLKAITVCYLKLIKADSAGLDPVIGESVYTAMEDSFSKFYTRAPSQKPKKTRAFHIKGTPVGKNYLNVIHGIISANELIKLAKSMDVTVTAYLATLFIYSIYEVTRSYRGSHPIKLCIPIDLRQFYETLTQRNFFTIITVDITFDKNGYIFEDILKIVSSQLKERVKPEYIMGSVNYYMEAERNIWARMVPLVFKNIALRLIYKQSGEETYTCTLSNLGKINVLPCMKNHVKRFDILVGASRKNTLNCGVCTFDDTMVISFTKSIMETDIERYFFRFLSNKGLKITVEQS